MDERYSKLEITPKLIDLGERVVQMKLVTSAGIGTNYPWRNLTWPALLSGLGFLFSGYSSSNGLAYRRPDAVDPAIIMGLAGAVLLFLAVLAWGSSARLLVIKLAGSDQIVLQSASHDFLGKVLGRIREAMIAPEDAPIHYTINITAGTIETGALVDLSSTTLSDSPAAAIVRGDVGGAMSTNASGHGQAGAHRPQPGAANGTRPRRERPEPPATAATAKALAGDIAIHGSPGALAVGGSVHQSTLTTQAIGVDRDLQSLIAMVEQARIADQAQVVRYLEYVRELVAAGEPRRAEARSAWSGFFDYAIGTLTGLDGLMAIVDRIDRWLKRQG